LGVNRERVLDAFSFLAKAALIDTKEDIRALESQVLPQGCLTNAAAPAVALLLELAAERRNLSSAYDLLSVLAIYARNDEHGDPMQRACAERFSSAGSLVLSHFRDRSLSQDVRMDALSVLSNAVPRAEWEAEVRQLLGSEKDTAFVKDALSFLG
jgi:hypothetical protein